MFELTGTQVAQLDDTALRELVFRLCEAELRQNNQPIASVTAGGNQTAPDGGIDVRVELPTPVKLDFIPRSQTGFQVKCEDMPAAKIQKEMCLGGELRPSILQLIEAGGAYIIVSSKGSTADGPRIKRIEAMRAAIGNAPNAAAANLDFYDRARLATWARGYPGVELWLRGRIGEPLSGWKSYGNWAGDKTDAPYLKDDLGRIFSKTTGNPEAMSVTQGIDAIREQLEKPGQAVRLIGLSGTGKTRLIQALFEAETGGQPLDKAIAVYTDQGDSPIPSARDMMEKLGANGRRAIVVVDNCTPETHQALAKIVAAHSSCLSLITVEYDVRDDEPEETQVFELTGSSPTVLDGILARLAPHVAQSDRWRIVEFSDGNARVALALVRTLKRGQTLGFLNDNELFKRLFMQNQGPDETLQRAAETCSLVYSFDGETPDGANAELPILATLADLTPKSLLRQITTLKTRKLVQTRSKWRAVLPHALANRLAKQALANLPRNEIMSAFRSHERLLKSFSRRLGYLHDSPEACEIAQQWMEKWLNNPAKLNDLEQALFFNLAPLVPEQALANLEAAVSGDQGTAFISSDESSHDSWMALARSLAYDPKLFDQAARICFAYAESEKPNRHTGREIWKALFYVKFSGTLAPPQQRIDLLRRILSERTPQQNEIAMEALAGMLESAYFHSRHDFTFGAHPRGYGWEPASADDHRTWYCSVFELVIELASLGSSYRDSVRAIVARELRLLWANLEMHQEVAALVRALAGMEDWPEGWTAVRVTLRHDSKTMSPEHLKMLNDLERLLQPATLEQNVRAYVFSTPWGSLDIADAEDDTDDEETGVSSMPSGYERVEEKVEELGKEVAADERLLERLLPDLLSNASGRKDKFGKGLALASNNVTLRWEQLCASLSQIEPSKRDINLILGFIEGAGQANATATEQLLDSAVSNPLLAEYFPLLQGINSTDAAGKRLLAALSHAVAPASRYYWVSFRLRGAGMAASLYRKILLKLAQIPGGFQVAIKLLSRELRVSRKENSAPATELISLGRELLGMFSFDIEDHNFGSYLKDIADACMQGTDAAPAAIALCQRFAEAMQDYRRSVYSFGPLADTLFKHQPAVALDAFLGFPGKALVPTCQLRKKSVVNSAVPEALLAWAKVAPAVRAPRLAAEIEIHDKDAEGLSCWSHVAASLLEMAPNKREVLDEFAQHFQPRSWSGSISSVLAPYQELATRLANGTDATVVAWAKVQLASMAEQIAQESRIDQIADQRFE
jgi:hypothetical protein